MAGLVPGGDFLVLVGHGHAAALAAPAHLVAGFLELGHADGFLVGASGQQRGLVEQVGQFRPGKPGRPPGNDAEVDRLGQFHLLGVHLEDLLAAAHVGEVHRELPVEAARAQQCGVEHIRPVGGGDDDGAFLSVEAVHLNEQRVERLLAFVVAAAQPVATRASHGVDLVDEHQAWRALAGLLEHVAHTAGADADEHLHKVRAADAEEGGFGFAGDGFGQ